MTSRIVVEVTEFGGVSITRKLIVDTDNYDINNNTDIYISKEREKTKMATTFNDVKAAIEANEISAEELGALIADYLNTSVIENTETAIGSKIENEGLLLASVITMVKNSEEFTQEFKERCIKRFTDEVNILEADLKEIADAGDEMNKVLEEAEKKQEKMDKYIKYAKVAISVTAAIGAAVVLFKTYRTYFPAVTVLDMASSTDVISEM